MIDVWSGLPEDPKVKLSNVLASMVIRVDNPESDRLSAVSSNPKSTHDDYVNATMDFLQTIPAFSDVHNALRFTDSHLIRNDDFDDTRVEDVPDHWVDLHD